MHRPSLHSCNPNEWPEVEKNPDLRCQKKRQDFSQIAVRDPVWNKLLWFHHCTLLLPTNSRCCPQQQVTSELAESAITAGLLACFAVGWAPQVRSEVHWWDCWTQKTLWWSFTALNLIKQSPQRKLRFQLRSSFRHLIVVKSKCVTCSFYL